MGVNFIIIRDVKNWADREVRLYWKIKQGIEAIRQIIWAKTAHNHFSCYLEMPREVFHFGWLTHHPFTLSVSTLRKTQKLQFIPYLFKVFMLPFDACFSLFTVNESPEKNKPAFTNFHTCVCCSVLTRKRMLLTKSATAGCLLSWQTQRWT